LIGTAARWVALTSLVAAALSGCSSGDDDKGDNGTEDPVVVEITFEDGTVTPSGDRVEVDAGQPVDLEVTADEPGEIHIHSDPEQELEYPAGSKTFKIEIDRPGVVAVESHDLDQVIVQLEVK